MLEKAKTTLFAFSPHSEELQAERVNLRGVHKTSALKSRANRENRAQSVAQAKANAGFALKSRQFAAAVAARIV